MKEFTHGQDPRIHSKELCSACYRSSVFPRRKIILSCIYM